MDVRELISQVQEFFGDFTVLDPHHFAVPLPRTHVVLQPFSWEFGQRRAAAAPAVALALLRDSGLTLVTAGLQHRRRHAHDRGPRLTDLVPAPALLRQVRASHARVCRCLRPRALFGVIYFACVCKTPSRSLLDWVSVLPVSASNEVGTQVPAGLGDV